MHSRTRPQGRAYTANAESPLKGAATVADPRRTRGGREADAKRTGALFMDKRHITGARLRELVRRGEHTGPTAGLALGFVQANLVVLPRALAFDFMLFCQRNPKPCPLLDVTEPGRAVPSQCAPDADIRTDVPRYRVYRHGELVDEPGDI